MSILLDDAKYFIVQRDIVAAGVISGEVELVVDGVCLQINEKLDILGAWELDKVRRNMLNIQLPSNRPPSR